MHHSTSAVPRTGCTLSYRCAADSSIPSQFVRRLSARERPFNCCAEPPRDSGQATSAATAGTAEPAPAAGTNLGKRTRRGGSGNAPGGAAPSTSAAAPGAGGDSGGGGGADEEVRHESIAEKRLKQNRDAARRSRERKRQLKEELQRRLPLLQQQHDSMAEVDELMRCMRVRAACVADCPLCPEHAVSACDACRAT